MDTSLTSQNTPTPLPNTGQDVGSLDIDASESDNTRDERGNGTRRYETSFSTASEGLLARAKVPSRWMAICQAVGCPGIPGSGAGSQIGILANKRSSYLWARTSLILKYELLLIRSAW